MLNDNPFWVLNRDGLFLWHNFDINWHEWDSFLDRKIIYCK